MIIQKFNFGMLVFPVAGKDAVGKQYDYKASVAFNFDPPSLQSLEQAAREFSTEAEFEDFERSIQRAFYMNASSYEHTSLASPNVPAVRIDEGERVDFILPKHYLNAANNIAFSMNYLGDHRWVASKARLVECSLIL